MAKKKKVTSNKVTKHVKKAYKKNPKAVTTLFIIVLLLVVGAFVYLYLNGYLDEYLNQEEDKNPPVESLYEQDENGFYYYNLTGYDSGDYYYRAKDLAGEDLAQELHIIINDGFNKVSYGDARYILAMSDRDPKNNNESVRGMYDSDVIATYWIGTGEGRWQREHVWPNSKLGVPSVDNNTKNQASDVHNLRAITGINQTRSNRYFNEGDGSAKTVGTEAFYPGDDHKGDVARILFYMDIMYEELELTNDTTKLTNNPNTNYTPAGAYSGLLDLLIKWHKEDPVDEFEVQRNNFIYNGIATNPNGKEITPQGNRNPFIDKPELVHLIWEGKEIEDLIKPEEDTVEMAYTKINIIYYVKLSKDEKWFC